ncbi:MAG: hypothetical protein V1824_02650 [archaeon]
MKPLQMMRKRNQMKKKIEVNKIRLKKKQAIINGFKEPKEPHKLEVLEKQIKLMKTTNSIPKSSKNYIDELNKIAKKVKQHPLLIEDRKKETRNMLESKLKHYLKFIEKESFTDLSNLEKCKAYLKLYELSVALKYQNINILELKETIKTLSNNSVTGRIRVGRIGKNSEPQFESNSKDVLRRLLVIELQENNPDILYTKLADYYSKLDKSIS